MSCGKYHENISAIRYPFVKSLESKFRWCYQTWHVLEMINLRSIIYDNIRLLYIHNKYNVTCYVCRLKKKGKNERELQNSDNFHK